jgi:hypothetical protein
MRWSIVLLIVKWKERGNQDQNHNQNQNIQMIGAEECNDHPRVAAITHGGMRTREDVTEKGKGVEKWIRKENDPIPTFDPKKRRRYINKPGRRC